jgi:hypothetical protein
MGMHLMGVYSMGTALIGMHLMGVDLMGVDLMVMHLMGMHLMRFWEVALFVNIPHRTVRKSLIFVARACRAPNLHTQITSN